jgi:hypothetical protein
MPGRHARMPQAGWRRRPLAELCDERALLRARQPSFDVDDVGQRTVHRARCVARVAERQRELAVGLIFGQDDRHATEAARPS